MRESQPDKPCARWVWRIVLVAAALAYLALWFGRGGQSGAVASAPLADGTVLHIEKVAYGTRHRIGQRDYFGQFFYWLPWRLTQFFAPKRGESTLDLPGPALVVWADVTDAKTGKDLDAQKMFVDFVDGHGELWGEETRAWFGLSSDYSRVAHVFTCFPRDEKTLTLRITPWKKGACSQVEFKNPCYTAPAVWTGLPLPQRRESNGLEIVLDHLTLATNGGPKAYSEPPARYWEPSWQLLRNGLPATGWDGPEWEAEDPLGNRGQLPNVRQPVLRFSAVFRPSPTNLQAAMLLAALPKINLSSSAANWWNITNRFQSNEIDALGFFPPGTHVFYEGRLTNYNPGLGPVGHGAPSGWVGQSRPAGLDRVRRFDGHYSTSPVIYLRYTEYESCGRIALRLRDDRGVYWPATPETQAGPTGIHPFILSPRPGVTVATPEIVLLKPVKASFLVNIPAAVP
jgi:hypothetical protein